MTEKINTVIIGAGQAGLAMSYCLKQKGIKNVILEQAPAVAPAWRHRWDSFTLVLPNWTLQLPGFPYQGDNPDGFLGRDDYIAYLEDYAAFINPEIRLNTRVSSVESGQPGDKLFVQTGNGSIEADNVVIAAGTFQGPKIPKFNEDIAGDITKIHTHNYQNPDALPKGGVLVVGTGQSGCQIAEELYQTGRKVYLCVGGATCLPRFYRG